MAVGDLITGVSTTHGAQYEWAGVLFGTGTDLIVESIDGLDSMPELVTDDVDRNDDHGAFLGEDLMKSRAITMALDMDEPDHATVMARYRTVARVMRPVNVEFPLAFQRPNEPKKQVFARPRARALPSNSDVASGLAKGTLMWVCGDPRIYSLVEHHAQIILPAGAAAGNVVINNGGEFEGYARFTLTGAGSNPRIEVTGQTPDPLDGHNDNGRIIAIDTPMGGGDVLTIDVKTRNIQLNGANAYGLRRTDNQWWKVMPGNQTITFSRTDTSGLQTLDIYWFDVWI